MPACEPAADVLIVGGGVSGLLAAHSLKRRGRRVEVWEAAPEVGGWARTLDWPGPKGRPGFLELGPQTLHAPGHSALLNQVRDLGLPLGRVRREGPRWLLDDAGLRPWSSAWRALGPAGWGRLLLEPFAPGPHPGETLSDLAVRRFGTAFATKLFPPLVGSLLAADPTRLDPLALPSLARADGPGGLLMDCLRHGRPKRWRVEGGMGRLAEALALELDVHLGTPLLSLSWESGGWRAQSPAGSLGVPRVVLALPAAETAAVLAPLAPEAARALGEVGTTRLWIRHTRHAPVDLDLGLRVHPGCTSSWVGAQGRLQGPWLQVATYFRIPGATAPDLPGLGPVLQERWTDAVLPFVPPGHAARLRLILEALPRGLDAVGAWRWGPGLADLAEGASGWG